MIKKRSAVLSQYIISYNIIALLACSIVGLSLFFLSSSALLKSAQDARLHKLQLAVQDIERQYSILQEIANRVAVTSYYRENFINSSEINKWRMLEDFQAYSSYSPIVTTYFLYRKTDQMIWKPGAMNSYVFYANSDLKAKDPEELQNRLVSINEPVVYHLNNTAILFLFPIHIDASRANQNDAVVGFRIDQAVVISRLTDIMAEISAPMILYYQDEPLFAYGETVDSADSWEEKKHILQANIPDGHFRLVMLKSTEQTMTDLASFRIISAVVISLSILLITWLGIYMAKRNYRPIRDLVKRYKTEVDNKQNNEIVLIDNMLHSAMEKSRITERKMNEQLRSLAEQKELLIHQFFQLVLAGDYRNNINEAAVELGISFDSDFFVIFLLSPARPEKVDGLALTRLINQLSDGNMIFYCVRLSSKDVFAIIVFADDESLFDEAAELIDALQREERLEAKIRQGTVYRDAHNLPVALTSALAANEMDLPYRQMAEVNRSHILLYDLIALLRSGDIERAHEKLNTYVDLIATTTPSVLHRCYIFADSLMILVRAVEDVNIATIPEKVGKILLASSFEEYKQGLSLLLDEMHEGGI